MVEKGENYTGIIRQFVAFGSWQDSVDFLVDRVYDRGLYVGGYASLIAKMAITGATELAIAYYREWVKGVGKYNPTVVEMDSFLSMYRQAQKLFM